MKDIIEEFARGIIILISGAIAIGMISSHIIDNNSLQSSVGITNTISEKGYTQPINVNKDFVFNVEETVDICVNEEYEPKEYASATLNDEDISDYILVQGVPSSLEPGTYEIEYILSYEGEKTKKVLTLNVQDNEANEACPEWVPAPKACSLKEGPCEGQPPTN